MIDPAPCDVSVVMTAWNAEWFIEAALRTVLDQTVVPEQIVVVDDGSTDSTAAIAEALDARVTVVRCAHAGVGASRNAGLAVAQRPLVAFIDADDLWSPPKLERQLAAFTEDRSREAIFCLFDEFADRDHPPPPGTRAPRLRQSASLSTGVVLPRAVVDRIGPFTEGPVADWIGWWARARALGVAEHVVPEVLYRRRIHSANNSFRNRGDGRDMVNIALGHVRELRSQRGVERTDIEER